MKIEHVAIWCKDLEASKKFYTEYFQATAGEKYINTAKKFESYFLSFREGARLELMYLPGIPKTTNDINKQFTGLTHFAMSVGNKQNVDALTEQLRKNGHTIVGEPRTTGDGYYESVVLDPEGNRIEITA